MQKRIMESSGQEKKQKKRRKLSRKKLAVIMILGVCVLAAAAYGIYRWIVQDQMSEETQRRESWVVETGELLEKNSDTRVNIYESATAGDIEIYQIQPAEVEKDKFTYYNMAVQNRLEESLETLKAEGGYTLESPLAVWNPYGTGTNGLYLYFETEDPSLEVHYRVHTENREIGDFQAQANAGDTRQKEFLVIGLVPGETCQVTVSLTDGRGETLQETAFETEVPQAASGYDTTLDHTQGDSGEELTGGLYYTLGTQGYYGHMFFYDNEGVMRYEMLLDGYKADRILTEGSDIIFCVSADQIGRLNSLGQVVQLYKTKGYNMHHDFNRGEEGKLLVLATRKNAFDDGVMDRILEIDMETGSVREILDLRKVFSDYYKITEKVGSTDTFFWQAGTRDWIHLNTIDYMGNDSLVLSSRETSTIIKLSDIHGEVQIDYLLGDQEYWEGTGYEEYVYEKASDFTGQYGQHTVTYVPSDDLEEGQYYLMLYDNNYYANSTRTDGYEPRLRESVSTDLMGGEVPSHVYFYLVDEKKKTYDLAWSYDVPYSSIVSSVQIREDNYVVNSGVSKVFGEYDQDGEMIREFSYETDFQGYRVMKGDFKGYWFL